MSIQTMADGTIIATGSQSTELYALMTMRSAFGLELKGMRRKGRQISTIVKAKYGFTGNKQAIYNQFSALVDQKKAEAKQA